MIVGSLNKCEDAILNKLQCSIDTFYRHLVVPPLASDHQYLNYKMPKQNSYTMKFKLEAIALAEALGSNRKAAAQLGVSEKNIRYWKLQEPAIRDAPRQSRTCCCCCHQRQRPPQTSTEAEGENHTFPWLPTDPYDDLLRPVDWQELFSGTHDYENDDGSSDQENNCHE